MRKGLFVLLTIFLVQTFAVSLASAETKKGGATAFAASCCLEPRIGLELNEGVPIRVEEWVHIFLFPIVSFEAYDKNGLSGAAASCCLGPRVGMELNERKIRTLEWMQLAPYVGFIPRAIMAVEAYQGKTMTEIEQEEGLKK